jgi:hypothetical protein
MLGVLILFLYATNPLTKIFKDQLGFLITIISGGDFLSNQRPLNPSEKDRRDIEFSLKV